MFLGDHHKNFIYRRCLSSYTKKSMLMNHKEKCGKLDITTIRTSNESHFHWNDQFQKNPSSFRIVADFEADNEIELSKAVCNKTTKNYFKNPVCKGYYIIPELEDVLKSEFKKAPPGYEHVDWFVNEFLKLEHKLVFYFKNTKKDIIMTDEDEEDYRKNVNCRFCEKNIESDKVRDHCHLTRKYRGSAYNTCNGNGAQKQSSSNPFVFHNFSNNDFHLFFQGLVDETNEKVKFDILPKANREIISVTFGCIGFSDRYRFISKNLDRIFKTLVDNGNKLLKD